MSYSKATGGVQFMKGLDVTAPPALPRNFAVTRSCMDNIYFGSDSEEDDDEGDSIDEDDDVEKIGEDDDEDKIGEDEKSDDELNNAMIESSDKVVDHGDS